MHNWRHLETELTDTLRRSIPYGVEIGDLDNGDKAIVTWNLGSAYEVFNITALARELDAKGVLA